MSASPVTPHRAPLLSSPPPPLPPASHLSFRQPLLKGRGSIRAFDGIQLNACDKTRMNCQPGPRRGQAPCLCPGRGAELRSSTTESRTQLGRPGWGWGAARLSDAGVSHIGARDEDVEVHRAPPKGVPGTQLEPRFCFRDASKALSGAADSLWFGVVPKESPWSSTLGSREVPWGGP